MTQPAAQHNAPYVFPWCTRSRVTWRPQKAGTCCAARCRNAVTVARVFFHFLICEQVHSHLLAASKYLIGQPRSAKGGVTLAGGGGGSGEPGLSVHLLGTRKCRVGSTHILDSSTSLRGGGSLRRGKNQGWSGAWAVTLEHNTSLRSLNLGDNKLGAPSPQSMALTELSLPGSTGSSATTCKHQLV